MTDITDVNTSIWVWENVPAVGLRSTVRTIHPYLEMLIVSLPISEHVSILRISNSWKWSDAWRGARGVEWDKKACSIWFERVWYANCGYMKHVLIRSINLWLFEKRALLQIFYFL